MRALSRDKPANKYIDEKYKHKNALIKIIFQPGFSGIFWH